jgi:hypothetical protein
MRAALAGGKTEANGAIKPDLTQPLAGRKARQT